MEARLGQGAKGVVWLVSGTCTVYYHIHTITVSNAVITNWPWWGNSCNSSNHNSYQSYHSSKTKIVDKGENSPLPFDGVLVEAILVIRLRNSGDAMPLPAPAVLLALNVELGVMNERVGEPSKGEEYMNGDTFRNRLQSFSVIVTTDIVTNFLLWQLFINDGDPKWHFLIKMISYFDICLLWQFSLVPTVSQ